MSVRLGYACISEVMRDQGVYTGRTSTIGRLTIEKAKELTLANIADMGKIILYNESIGIRFWRMTSNLFPHMENPKLSEAGITNYTIDFARDELAKVGGVARRLGHRLTMHPGQFAQLGSPTETIVNQTIADLTHHSMIFKHMGLTPELGSVMIIHGGGTYGDKTSTLERFESVFRRLPESVSKYISLENDEYNYSIEDLLPMCERLKIPLCVDFFHHQVMTKRATTDPTIITPTNPTIITPTTSTPTTTNPNTNAFPDPRLLTRVALIWKLRGIKPKCHWSNQRPNSRDGTHGDYISCIPREILEFARANDVDIMCECKKHDLCAMKMLEMHFNKVIAGDQVYWELK